MGYMESFSRSWRMDFVINVGDVKKLQDAGIYTCNGLMMHTKKDTQNLVVERREEQPVNPVSINAFEYLYLNLRVSTSVLYAELKLQGEKTGRKGHLSVVTEIYEVAPSLCMVELRKAGEDTLEFHKFYKSFATGLKDIVWKSGDETKEEANDVKKIVLCGRSYCFDVI
ncbi:hypothetical protein CsSME_00011848 [Camellia sinensis var. sinensis]